MKKAILICFISGFFTLLKAQSNNQIYLSNEKITVSQATQNCHDNQNGIHKEYIFLTLTNKTDEAIRVSYKKQLWYNGMCTTCNTESNEHQFSVVLNPKETITANCENKNKALAIFSKMLNMKKSELTQFELADIQITTIK